MALNVVPRPTTARRVKTTVAHNNLGYLHLERAKRELERAEGSRQRPSGDERTKEELYEAARRDLEKAESCCERAIASDATYPHAYDNLGNVWIERTRLPDCDRSRAFEEAEKSYHKAISYDPNYSSAYSDLALLHVRQSGEDDSEESEPAAQGAVSARQDHARRAWRFHFSAVECLGDLEARSCAESASVRRCAPTGYTMCAVGRVTRQGLAGKRSDASAPWRWGRLPVVELQSGG